MNEKTIIENIQRKNSDYNYPEQAQNQYESLVHLTSAFSEYIRFLFELIQNADDAQASEVEVHIQNEFLIISHNGNPFNEKDVVGICNVGTGTKKEDTKSIGYKGIGFKSVFGKSSFVSIISNGFQFRFDEEKKNGKFPVMPWQIIPYWTDKSYFPNIIKAIIDDKEWNVNTIIQLELSKELVEDIKELLMKSQILLFLRNIKKIKCTGILESCIEKVNLTKDLVNLTENDKISQWIVWNVIGEIDNEIKETLKTARDVPYKIKLLKEYELSFAAKLTSKKIKPLKEDESLIFTYLPTKVNFRFPFLINSNFLADTSRELIYEDNQWNQWLMKIAGKKIIEWFIYLNQSEYAYQILNLIPQRNLSNINRLTNSFFDSFNEYLNVTPFIPNEENKLKKVSDIIIDETGLSKEKTFINQDALVEYINKMNNKSFKKDSFVHSKLELSDEKLPLLGSMKFEISDLTVFFTDKSFTDNHNVNQNFHLIKFFYNKAKSNDNWNQKLKTIPFIFAKGKKLKAPLNLMFPIPEGVEIDDSDNVRSSVPEIHKEVYSNIDNDSDIRIWLSQLGVKEPEDIINAIIDNSASIISSENYLRIIRYLYNQHNKGLLVGKYHLLSEIRLFTTKKELVPAKDCYLANIYEPRLRLQKVEKDLNFISEKYIENGDLPSQWKTFFLKIGVIDGINSIESIISYHGNHHKYFDEWFNLYRSFDNPYYDGRVFTNYFYKYRFSTIALIEKTSNFEFSKLFWSYVVSHLKYQPGEGVYGYWSSNWGYEYQHKTQLTDFVIWLIENKEIIPTTQNNCLKAKDVFINEKDIVDLASKFLPVFDCDEIPDNEWKELLNLKPKLEIKDYLFVLSAINEEIEKYNTITEINKNRIIRIYEALILKNSRSTKELIKEWSLTNKLLSTNFRLLKPSDLIFLLEKADVTLSDDLDQIFFPIDFNKFTEANEILNAFGVNVITDFKLITSGDKKEETFANDLLSVITYLAAIIEKKEGNTFDKHFNILEKSVKKISFIKSESIELAVIYEGHQNTISKPDSYFDKNTNTVYFKGDWNSPITLYSLVENISEALNIKSYENELRLFLQLNTSDISAWLKDKFEIDVIDIQEKSIVKEKLTGITKTDVYSKSELQKEIELYKNKIEQLEAELQQYKQPKGDNTRGEAPWEEMEAVRLETLEMVKRKLEQDENYDCSGWDNSSFPNTLVKGVLYKQIPIKLVVRSCQRGRLHLLPKEWLLLSELNTFLVLRLSKHKIEVIPEPLKELADSNNLFNMNFDLERLSTLGVTALSKAIEDSSIKYVGVGFVLDAPRYSRSIELDEIGLYVINQGAISPAKDDEF